MNFIKCGLLGWCIEIIWTGFHSYKNNDKKMMGNTSILMFPIYGMASIIHPLYKCLKNLNIFFRGIFYTIGIFVIEYTSGYILKKKGKCPWDYSDSKYNIGGLVRIDYAPAWFIVGLFFEKILNTTHSRSHTHK